MKKLFLIFSIFTCFNVFAAAQEQASENEQKVEATLKSIPLTGSRTEDFVPAGWEITGTAAAQGDLNGDGLADYAFDIALKNEPDGNSGCFDAVIILFAESGGKLRRVGLNNNLSTSGFCERQDVKIEKNVVVTNSNYGNNYANDVTFRFRYDATAKQMMLIGFDWESYTRSSSENDLVESYNLLTGVREETINYVNKNLNSNQAYDRQTKKRTGFQRLKIPFEKASYEVNDKGIGIPIAVAK